MSSILLLRILSVFLREFPEYEVRIKREKVGTSICIVGIRRAVRIQILDENEKEIKMVTISPDMKRVFSIQPVDGKGRPAKVDGVPEWTISPSGGATLFPAPDGMSCEVAWLAVLAGQVLTVKADADLGAGVKEITGSADIETLAAQATTLSVSVGPEVPNV